MSKLPDTTTIFTTMSALAQRAGALNLSQGFPDFPAPEALTEALARATRSGLNQYAPMAGLDSLREAIATQLQRYRQVRVDPLDEITIVPGATESIFCAVMAMVKAGDEVIVLDPHYDSYVPAITLAGGRPIHVPLLAGTFLPDWQAIEAAITPQTRMMIVNSPHNPTGAVWTDNDLRLLERLACEHQLWVCSDEVYEFLVYDELEHRSVLQYPALRARSFAHFSFGKTFSVTGWKTGYCVAPPGLTRELRKIHQFVTFVAVTPIQAALAQFMQEHPTYPEMLRAQYQARRDRFCNALAQSRFQLTPSQGTYFQLLDYSAICEDSDTALSIEWTQNQGIASIPVSVFYAQPPTQTLLRFCFAKTDETLDAATDILCKI